jgi:FMN phosphatase YigB (HAD superfamily)
LRTLSTQGYKLALMTNYNCDRVFQRTIDYLGIRPFFDLCLSSASIEYRKPDASFFQVALDRWDALPYEVVVVGDSLLHDIQGGINLGALTVHAAFDSDPQVAFDNARLRQEILPDASIDDLRKLPEQIDIWANPKK